MRIIEAAEGTSYVFLIGSLAIFLVLAFRERAVTSLPFYLLIFTLILLVAETPRTFKVWGLPVFTPYLQFRAVLHAAALLSASSFITYRWYRTVREVRFGLVQEAVVRALTTLLGDHTARVVRFYVNENLAVKDPDAYTDSLKRMFGEGADLIIQEVCNQLMAMMGVKRGAHRGLKECIKALEELKRKG